MSKMIHLSRLSVQKVTQQTDYASSDALAESLNMIKATWNVPIDRYVQDLIESKVDSISFTKDNPYGYFFGRRFGNSLSVTIKETGKIVEFSIPLHEVEKMLTV